MNKHKQKAAGTKPRASLKDNWCCMKIQGDVSMEKASRKTQRINQTILSCWNEFKHKKTLLLRSMQGKKDQFIFLFLKNLRDDFSLG